MTYRALKDSEIAQLKQQGCSSQEWNKVEVKEGFSPDSCFSVAFSGTVKLGIFDRYFENSAGLKRPSGIFHATVHNCTVGDNVRIDGVHNYIANYDIADNVLIENVDTIYVDGVTGFGNGVEVAVMNEKGGRSIRIFNTLNAQLAYMLVFYRYKSTLIEQIDTMVDAYIENCNSDRGYIGSHTAITNSRELHNVRIGSHATINGTERLYNGSVNSTENGPVFIGTDVIADNFIINENSSITDSSIISYCFVGEAAEISKQFSAEHSLFFANFIGHHGESYSIFAGPHTATHHKSTLLISAYLSFMNAGSGSNQSNHTYKLGPIHQGIMGRGSKTASDSYILWPAKIGEFTLLLGRHTSNCDTSDIPYSMLLEGGKGVTLLVPGVNLKSVGTIRDADKWPDRDKRTGTKADIINYDLLTPYTAGKMFKGRSVLEELKDDAYYSERNYRYKGVDIPRESLDKGISYYTMGLIKYLGNTLIHQLERCDFSTVEELRSCLSWNKGVATGKWCDMAGMIVPRDKLTEFCKAIEQGKIYSLDTVNEQLHVLHVGYHKWAWNWCAKKIEEYIEEPLSSVSIEKLIEFVSKWYDETVKLDEYFINDASKEFARSSQVGFGLDGDKMDVISDFVSVRGSLMDNDFVQKIKQHIDDKGELRDVIINKLEKLFS